MTEIADLQNRRLAEQERIRYLLNSVRAEEEASLKGGLDTVAWVKEEQCIGCDQCTIVCDDDAIELFDSPLLSPILNIDVNKKFLEKQGEKRIFYCSILFMKILTC